MLFFRWVGPGAVGIRSRVLTSFPSAGADRTWLHQTLIEALLAMAMASAENAIVVLCGLETYRCPHTVLLKEEAARVRSPVSARFGGGAAHVTLGRPSPYGTGAGAGVQSTAEGSGHRPMCSCGVH